MGKLIVTIVIPYTDGSSLTDSDIRLIAEQKYQMSDSELAIILVNFHGKDRRANHNPKPQMKLPDVYYVHTNYRSFGSAMQKGVEYALNGLHADIIIGYDYRLGDAITDLHRLISQIKRGSDIVIISSYQPSGNVVSTDGAFGSIQRWAGAFIGTNTNQIKPLSDLTGGLFAVRSETLKKVGFAKLKVLNGSFFIPMLYYLLTFNYSVVEIPFSSRFTAHKYRSIGNISGLSTILAVLRSRFHDPAMQKVNLMAIGIFLFLSLLTVMISQTYSPFTLFKIFIFLVSTFIMIQSVFFLYATIYAWNRPERIEINRSPKTFMPPKYSFTALLPARHEEAVIGETIKTIAAIEYPSNLTEVLVICRTDDEGTISEAQKAIDGLKTKNIRLITFSDFPINKPHGLNVALPEAKNDILVIFDAEDSPHSDIYTIVNTVFVNDRADVVQSGVQLMNFHSTWFSTLNVLEYFFWFKSALHFFNGLGVTPLGGNTVFFKRKIIEKIGGWCETCLTEDAQIGINLSSEEARVRVVYDEKHATQEETPPDMLSFIKQRTRWNQGFLQILFAGDWLKLPGIKRKLIAGYLLAWPEIQTLYFLYLPISLITIFVVKLPLVLAIYSTLPFYLFILQFLVLNIGLFEFTREYKLRYPFWMPIKIALTTFPYQLLLGISAIRASLRLITGSIGWEKTAHINAHRSPEKAELSTARGGQ